MINFERDRIINLLNNKISEVIQVGQEMNSQIDDPSTAKLNRLFTDSVVEVLEELRGEITGDIQELVM
jgi:hypothetical protein